MTKRPFVQLAYFVEDVREAAQWWYAQRGAGPFLVMDNIALDNPVYRGQPTELDHSSAYGQLGDIMLELVQQNNQGPSAFRDCFADGESGLHHMAQFAVSLDAELAEYRAQGYETVFRADAGEVSFAFVDTRPVLGHMIELYQDCDAIRDFYALISSSATQSTEVFIEL